MRARLLAAVVAAALAGTFAAGARAAPNAPPPSVHHPRAAPPAPSAPPKGHGGLEAVGQRKTPAVKPVASAARGTPVAWHVALERLSAFEADVDSGAPSRLTSALHDFEDLRLDWGSLQGFSPGPFDSELRRASTKLLKHVTGPSERDVKLAAIKAFAKFAGANTDGYQRDLFTKFATDRLHEVYGSDLPDDVRRVAFDEIQKVPLWRRSATAPKTFKTIAELRAERMAVLRRAAAAPPSDRRLAWDRAEEHLAAFEMEVDSGSLDRISAAVHRVGELKLDLDTMSSDTPGDHRAVLTKTFKKLTKLVLDGPDAVRSQAMHALAKFVDTNSNGYRRGRIGRDGIDYLALLYWRAELGDATRKVAFDELVKFDEAMKGERTVVLGTTEFTTSAQLQKEAEADAR